MPHMSLWMPDCLETLDLVCRILVRPCSPIMKRLVMMTVMRDRAGGQSTPCVTDGSVCNCFLNCMVQRNLTKVEGNVGELEAKLKHEQEKFKTYNKDLMEAEKK